MDNHFFKLLTTHKRRFTAAEKHSFLSGAARIFSGHGLKCDIAHSSAIGWHADSLIVGDIASAHTVVVARFNTPKLKLLPVPAYIGSFFGSFVSYALPTACILAVSAVAGRFLPYPLISFAVIAALLLFAAFAAFPCPNNASASSGVLAAAMTAKAHGVCVILADGCFFGLPERRLLKKLDLGGKAVLTLRYAVGSELAVGSPYPELFTEGARAYKRKNTVIDIAEPTVLGLCINKRGSVSDTELDIECAAKAAQAALSASKILRDII